MTLFAFVSMATVFMAWTAIGMMCFDITLLCRDMWRVLFHEHY